MTRWRSSVPSSPKTELSELRPRGRAQGRLGASRTSGLPTASSRGWDRTPSPPSLQGTTTRIRPVTISFLEFARLVRPRRPRWGDQTAAGGDTCFVHCRATPDPMVHLPIAAGESHRGVVRRGVRLPTIAPGWARCRHSPRASRRLPELFRGFGAGRTALRKGRTIRGGRWGRPRRCMAGRWSRLRHRSTAIGPTTRGPSARVASGAAP
jgi:hypothetical protein